jgi:hypothetical protein
LCHSSASSCTVGRCPEDGEHGRAAATAGERPSGRELEKDPGWVNLLRFSCCCFLVLVGLFSVEETVMDDSTITPILVLMSAPDVGRLSSLTIDSCFPLFSSSSSSFLMVVVVTVRACSLKAFLSSSTTAREKSKSESCGETERRRRRMIHYFDL